MNPSTSGRSFSLCFFFNSLSFFVFFVHPIKHNKIKDWHDWAEASIKSLPDFLDNTFPEWEFVSAEDALYESIENVSTKFKGYIDCIIKVKTGSKYKYWIIDWKTARISFIL